MHIVSPCKSKLRLRVVFLSACLLTALVGVVHAADGDSSGYIKLIDGYTGNSQILAPGESTTMSNTYYTNDGGKIFSSSGSYTSSGGVNVVGSTESNSVDGPQTIAGLPITSATTRFFGQGNRFISSSKTTPNTDPSSCPGRVGEPIVMSTGAKTETYADFVLPGEMGLQYQRFYISNYFNHLNANLAWSDTFSYALDDTCLVNPTNGAPCRQVIISRPNGSYLVFNGGSGGYVEQSGGGLATLVLNANGTYTLKDEDGTTQVYTSNAADANGVVHSFGAIQSLMDASGIGWTFTYPGDGSITITHTNGQSITKKPNGSNAFTVTDPAGNVFSYTTLSNGSFASVSFPGTPATTIAYQYTNASYPTALSEVDYNGVAYARTTYDSNGRANGTANADGSEATSIMYNTVNGFLTPTVTNALGHTQTNTYGTTVTSNGASVPALTSTSDNAVADCGATVHARAYDANGNLSQETDNNGNVHKYTYAANGQLQTEIEAYGTSVARTTDYVWDPNQQLNRLSSVTIEGWSKTVYTYNTQNRLASVAVTNLSSTGTANQTLTTSYAYTLYSNGMVQTMSVTHPSPGNSNTDVYNYDALGHLTSLANGLGQTTTYSNYNALGQAQHVVGPNGDVTDYTYDPRGRLSTKKTYPYGITGTWTYGYDGYGLLASLTTPDNESTTWNRDPEMRVTTIVRNDKDGNSTETFGYDANSDVTSHTIARGTDVSVSETAKYDALGRLYQKFGTHGQSLTYAYDGNGNVLSVTDAVGHVTSYQYDALNRVSQKTESGGASPAIPSPAPTISVPSSNTSGAYTVSWNSISGATSYPLQEQVNGGSWTTIQNNGSLSWGASGKTSNSYGYRVQACNASGCSAWSSVGTVNVAIPTAPTSAPSLTVPSSSTTGNYTVSWGSVANTSTYTLQEQMNGGGWSTVQNNTALNWTASGKTSANYGYQVQACNAVGCGPWSGTGTINVAIPQPPATPATPSTPANNATGSYTVSWNAVSAATSYQIQQQVNGGSWSVIQNSAATSWSASGESNGTYGYEVQACNVGGCSAWSGTASTVVTIPVPIAINGNTYAVSYIVPKGSGTDGIGFDIVNGNTWEVYTTKPGVLHGVSINGTVPSGAVTVQYTWTDGGVPGGDQDSAGSVTNTAASPTAISSNPYSQYNTAAIASNVPSSGHQYQLRVDFFNAAGNNISSSTCTLRATITGSTAEVVRSGAN